MEGPEQRKAALALIRQAMPRVAAMVAEKRRDLGDAHVIECQQRGMAGHPGWFYAREGTLAVGTPWPDAREAEAVFDAAGSYAGKALLCLRPLEVAP